MILILLLCYLLHRFVVNYYKPVISLFCFLLKLTQKRHTLVELNVTCVEFIKNYPNLIKFMVTVIGYAYM